MISPPDGRDNVEDWFFLENTKKGANNPETTPNSQHETEQNGKEARKRTKDFIEHELRAMSTLSLYDDSLDKMKTIADADKWVIVENDEKVFISINHQQSKLYALSLVLKVSQAARPICMSKMNLSVICTGSMKGSDFCKCWSTYSCGLGISKLYSLLRSFGLDSMSTN